MIKLDKACTKFFNYNSILVIWIPGLRYVSWIMYGAAMVYFMLFFRWDLIAAGNNRLPDGQINIDAAIFFIASMLMIAEVWTTSKRKD